MIGKPAPPLPKPVGAYPPLEEIADIRDDLIAFVRSRFAEGLSESFIRSCLRIGYFEKLGGGLKSSLVGRMTVHVAAVVKRGDAEIPLHETLMGAANARSASLFSEVLGTMKLGDSDYLMLMEDLRKHESLMDRVFSGKRSEDALSRVIEKTLEGLRIIHHLNPAAVSDTNPPRENQIIFTSRLRNNLKDIIKVDPVLKPMMRSKGHVMQGECRPLTSLLDSTEAWEKTISPVVVRSVVHGDPHLLNVMFRRYGKGYRVRFIDPNPMLGLVDPAYDIGKLFHFAEAVGWAKRKPSVCRASFSAHGRADGWHLNGWLNGVAPRIEANRAWFENRLREKIAKTDLASQAEWSRRLALARASAHIGLAAIIYPNNKTVGRFVLSHALNALSEW